ncbi:hypothetical protein pdul_cds_101 [Pandoravirus dulcis]|uniref:Transmembrane protein n=1 Tax=Pandoravirus dulcis TaxID=1349409 RepID=S4VVA6_9VIRU|nr:hypothetical protein pdul_cds_101 [Pandoravirus dulcis]AGO82006.1 hypothetical protein pdul_cds_101 [Pandoravirus dulcis]
MTSDLIGHLFPDFLFLWRLRWPCHKDAIARSWTGRSFFVAPPFFPLFISVRLFVVGTLANGKFSFFFHFFCRPGCMARQFAMGGCLLFFLLFFLFGFVLFSLSFCMCLCVSLSLSVSLSLLTKNM